jgi:protein involved in polysaccharide export with SLBB domain
MQKMKAPRNFAGLLASIVIAITAGLSLTGCETEQPYMPVSGVTGLPPAVTNAAVGGPYASVGKSNTNSPDLRHEVLHVGDLVAVTRISSGDIPFGPFSEHIREDGTITPPDVGPVKAAERTPSDLQRELQQKYEKIYRNITVTVTAGERYYHVVGEVNLQGPKVWLGNTDVVQAISAAGGMNEFASYNMKLFHPNGKSDPIDFKKALLGDPQHNRQILPGDKIVVKRRWL